MGESHSTYSSSWTQDPKYDNARQTLKKSDKETQKMADDFLKEQNRLRNENSQMQREIQRLRDEIKNTPHHHAKPQQERYVHGNTTDNRKLLGDCLQQQEKLQRDNERLTKKNKKLMDDNIILSNEKESALTR
jgi:hypothetical protein